MAGSRACPEAPSCLQHPLHVQPPGLRRELGEGKEPHRLPGEGPAAAPAEPPLRAIPAMPLAHEIGGPAPRARRRGIACTESKLPRHGRLGRLYQSALVARRELLHLMEYSVNHPVPRLLVFCLATASYAGSRTVLTPCHVISGLTETYVKGPVSESRSIYGMKRHLQRRRMAFSAALLPAECFSITN